VGEMGCKQDLYIAWKEWAITRRETANRGEERGDGPSSFQYSCTFQSQSDAKNPAAKIEQRDITSSAVAIKVKIDKIRHDCE